MLNKISKYLERPNLYAQSEENFWNDTYISKQLLKAHLDTNYEGASRKLEFIEDSVSWIKQIISLEKHRHLLDVGCGPGLYAERFAKAGYQVTGIDFSKRSISYAANSAKSNGLDIVYRYQNYLELDENNMYDCATLIYCDYGALSTKNRQSLMQKIYICLKPEGKFLLDVFSMERYNSFQEIQTWSIYQKGGFWSPNEYLSIDGCHKYPKNVTLEQNVIITNDTIKTYYIWNCYFTRERLIGEAQEAGFKVLGIFGDAAGQAYTGDSPTIAILLEK